MCGHGFASGGAALALVAAWLCDVASYAERAQEPIGGPVVVGAYTSTQGEAWGGCVRASVCRVSRPELDGRLAGVRTGVPAKWEMLPMADLFDRISISMPANAPGTLTGPQNADVLAYILSLNGQPAGRTELPADGKKLQLLRIGGARADEAPRP